MCVILQGIDILTQDLKLAVRLNCKQESTAKQGKILQKCNKINLAFQHASMPVICLSHI